MKVRSYSESDNLFGKSVHYIRFNASLLDTNLTYESKTYAHNRYDVIDVIVNE